MGDLLFTKFITPPRRPNLIERGRLYRMLDTALARHQRLVLVSARAGSGKTTLVSEWLHTRDMPSTWISLGERDSDPLTFFSYLSEALSSLGITIARSTIKALSLDPLPDPAPVVAEFANAISRHQEGIIIALDDFHNIRDEWVHNALEHLIDLLPPQVLLIMISRKDPPYQLSKLRACDQLTEIRSRDLRFSLPEAALFFQETMGVDLDESSIAALENRTEGWIAGLQLAGISLKESAPFQERAAFFKGLAKTNRFILDYLTEEVLRLQPEPLQDFLLETSILRIMNSRLCDAVHLPRPRESKNPRAQPRSANPAASPPVRQDGQSVLEYLEKNNLFIIPLDENREWYRYHHLFADLLQIILQQSKPPEHVNALHSRAARWHQVHGSSEEAMYHAIAAGDYDFAASLINEDFAGLFSRNQVPVFLSWIEKLPEEIRRKFPWINLYQAYTHALSGRPDLVEPLLSQAESKISALEEEDGELTGQISAIRAYTANLNQDADTALTLAAGVLDDLPANNVLARGMAAYTLADAKFARDDLAGAGKALETMLHAGEQSNTLLLSVNSLCEMAEVQTAAGNLRLAQGTLSRVNEKLDGLGLAVSREICAYDFAMANFLCARNELDQALFHAREGLEFRDRLGGYLVIGDLALMRVLQARGDVSGALDALAKAEEYFAAYHYQLAVGCRFRAARVTQWLLAGDTAMAQQAALDCGDSELEVIAKAKLQLALGAADGALAILEPQLTRARQGGRNGRLLEMLLITALAQDFSGDPGKAQRDLQEAILLAKPEGYLRVFLDLGSSLRRLLKRYLEGKVPPDAASIEGKQAGAFGFETHLLQAFESMPSPGLKPAAGGILPPNIDELLTDREQEVLALLALGITNKEIAAELVVAPSTVKEHLKNIYSKLEVNSRTQAVHRGRDLGLL